MTKEDIYQKHQNLSRKNKTKQKKLTSNNKNNNKRIRMF